MRRVAASRRSSATTSWDVGPAGFAMTRTPCMPGASGWRGTFASGGSGTGHGACEALGLCQHATSSLGEGGVDARPSGAGMAATAERTGQCRRVDATGLRAYRDARGGRAGFLEEDRHLRGLGLCEQVDEALGM